MVSRFMVKPEKAERTQSKDYWKKEAKTGGYGKVNKAKLKRNKGSTN